MVQCEIKFEGNPLGTYYTGSVVNGKVEILLNKPMDVRGIVLTMKGKGKVRWSESESVGTGKNRTTRSVSYYANEDYIRTITYLYGSENGSTITLSKGAHLFNFSCLIPFEAPSSIEGHYGNIRYTAKVVFDRPWKFDKTFTVAFTVLKLTNLNMENLSIRIPVNTQVEKTFCCWPCSSKPLIVEVTIPQSGYVSGQCIPVTINLYNQSGTDVDRIGVSLKKIMICHSDYPRSKTKTEIITVKKIIIDPIKNEPKETINVDLLVPPIPPTTTMDICRIIQVNYELHIKAKIGGPHRSPRIIIPVTIGNIPLYNSQQFQTRSMASAPMGNDAPSPSSPEISASDFGLAPPTYEEALYIERVNLNDGNKNAISESNFLPRYPVFHFEPSAPTDAVVPRTSLMIPKKVPNSSVWNGSKSKRLSI